MWRFVMRLGKKMLIAAAAVVLTLAGFNLLVSSSTLDIIRAGRTAGMEIVVTAQAPAAVSAAHTS
jgi:hypothetical protein